MAGPSLEPSPSSGDRPNDRGGPRRLTLRRLVGLDRSGPPPPQTLAGQPLRPWTIPNTIGFARLALIPVFLIVAFSRSGGTGTAPAALFAIAAAGDYADGIAARATGQYSRLGTLLDPITDRLLVISGVVVCLCFDLLPGWALIVLIARELVMLVLGRYAQTHGIELQINWPGRIGVGPLMASIVLAIAGLHTLAEVLLYVGLALALTATVLYVRAGMAQMRRPGGSGAAGGVGAGGAGGGAGGTTPQA